MFASIYDKTKDKYFKSYIYGIINAGFYSKCIVLNPNTKTFYAVNYLDTEDPNVDRCTFINIIDSTNDDFKTISIVEVKELNKKFELKKYGFELKTLAGYEDVLADLETLKHILIGEEVHEDKVSFKAREDFFAGEDWVQINSQGDANELMKIFGGFHDSVLESFSYKGESEMMNPNMDMKHYGKRRSLSMIFHSGWYGKIELCFDGVILMKNKPAGDNYSDELFSATLLVKEGKVFWAEEDLGDIDLNYDYSFVYAYNLRWRTVFKLDKSWKDNFR